MSGILAALVEWFAIISMSLLGIDYTPAVNCEPDTTTEYMEAAYILDGNDGLQNASVLVNAGDCASLRIDFERDSTPLFLETPVTYDS